MNRSLLHPKQEGWSKLPHGPVVRRRGNDPTATIPICPVPVSIPPEERAGTGPGPPRSRQNGAPVRKNNQNTTPTTAMTVVLMIESQKKPQSSLLPSSGATAGPGVELPGVGV